MPTTTANLGLTLPTPNVDTGWGGTLNADFTIIDNIFAAAGDGPSVGLNVGSGKTLNVGGTLRAQNIVILGSGDGTNTVAAPVIRGVARTGTNAAGVNLTIDAPNGTGTGGSGAIVFRAASPGANGSSPNTMVPLLTIGQSFVYGNTMPAYDNTTKLATTAQVYNTVTTSPYVYYTTSRTLQLSDLGKLLLLDSTMTLTIPTNAAVPFPGNARIDIVAWGTGNVTISPDVGVTLNSSGGRRRIASPYSGATIININLNEWLLIGDLS
jgi:hypothetical protein